MNDSSIIKIFQAGGLVMWPLLVFSVVVVMLSIERMIFWYKTMSHQKNFVQRFFASYRRYPQLKPQELSRDEGLPLARIFMAALSYPTTEGFRLALETESQAELPALNRFSEVFDAIITLSPLLGLLGTVTGLMNSFANLNIGNASATNTTNISAGIGEALITTAAGLIVAIFASIMASFFRSFYQRQLIFLQEYCGQAELIHLMHREQTQVSMNKFTADATA